MTNRLADETSPYLQQHADNPVDWYPWGEEAFTEAKRRDVPLFVSVGYSSCHWCHVMAHESFEDPEVAAVMNERFVNVKVDREERPDVDAVYMQATQALTGRGGWPMSVFTTPDGRPFYAGTYWPRESRHGMPSFPEVLDAVHEAWTQRRDEVGGQADKIADALDRRRQGTGEGDGAFDPQVVDRAVDALVDQAWDRELGGFGQAPKFPQAMTIEFLLDHHARIGHGEARSAAVHSLDAMARGGIHDQVGGGFHRYSTDARWLVPHFEKMLYDNALLLSAYAKAATLTGDGDDRHRRVVRDIHGWLTREMRHDLGGFYAATDADSEGEEGRFFVWSRDELVGVLEDAGLDGARWADHFGATADGNWEGTNILHVADPDARVDDEELDRVREVLYEHRGQRVHPGLDDKVITSWNALAIRGLARAGAHLRDPALTADAATTAGFVEEHLVVDGRLHHHWKDGAVGAPAFLEDVALLAGAYLDLYQTTGELRWYERARTLADDAVERFRDPDGGYYQTADDAEDLYVRPKETWDNATPSGNSVLAGVFARLAGLTGEGRWHDRAVEVVTLFQEALPRMPTGYGELLQAAEFLAADRREIAIVGPDDGRRRALEDVVWSRPRPGTVVATATEETAASAEPPLLAGRTAMEDGSPAAYVCRDFVCERPLADADALADVLGGADA